MAITYTIPGVKPLDQLQEPSNPKNDCVFTSNAVLANAYLDTSYTGTQLKAMDSDYGPNYLGGASEAKLADTMARLGITMTRRGSSTQAGLIAILHSEIAQGHGVICTIPSQWNSAVTNAGSSWNPRTYSGPSHVVLMCGYGPGMLRAMNPWGGFWQDESDSWWATRLLTGDVWVGTLATGGATVGIPTGWKDSAGGDVTKFDAVLTAPNGVVVIHGFRKWVLTHPWASDNWPERAEEHRDSVEWGNDTIGAGARQDFRTASLGWTAARDVYQIWTGGDLLALEHNLSDANAQIGQLRAQLAAALDAAKPDPLAAKWLAIGTSIKAALGEL